MLESVAPAWGGGPIVGFFTFLECLIILLKNVMLVYEKYFFKACIDILQNFVGYFDINNKFFQVKINFHHLKVAGGRSIEHFTSSIRKHRTFKLKCSNYLLYECKKIYK